MSDTIEMTMPRRRKKMQIALPALSWGQENSSVWIREPGGRWRIISRNHQPGDQVVLTVRKPGTYFFRIKPKPAKKEITHYRIFRHKPTKEVIAKIKSVAPGFKGVTF